jgi:hypothetical protein
MPDDTAVQIVNVESITAKRGAGVRRKEGKKHARNAGTKISASVVQQLHG